MSIHLNFSYKKATQVLNYFAIKGGGHINKMKALKLTYFADRYHLRKYGRPITNDEYFAMTYGPVASGVKDIAEMSDFLSPDEREYACKFIEVKNRYYLFSKKPYDKNVFSESDIEALLFVWDKFSYKEEFELVNISHQYPEWKKHEKSLKSTSRIKMNLEDFFDDPLTDVEKCYPLDVDDKIDLREQLKELSKLETLWS